MGETTPPSHTPARLEDIAQRVGISRSEVSRVLNGRIRAGRSVGKAKQDEIRKVAQELNYQPHQGARNLARGRTDVIALPVEILPEAPLSPHYQEIISALTLALHEYGFRLLLAQSGESAEVALNRLAQTRCCDGILLTDMRTHDQRPALLEQLSFPFVVRGSSPLSAVPAVGIDNRAVGRLGVETLARLGHRRIVCQQIGADYMAGFWRRQGACEAAEDAGIADTVLVDDSLSGEEGGYTLARTVLTGPQPPTALIAADELAAFGMLRAIAELGLRVPEDVSVLGCLNARILRRVHPNLTVINLHQDMVAREAGRMLARQLRGERIPREQRHIEPALEEGSSLAPPIR
jgi:DNA-binding LacI/PurR family transcriptional regulator